MFCHVQKMFILTSYRAYTQDIIMKNVSLWWQKQHLHFPPTPHVHFHVWFNSAGVCSRMNVIKSMH